MFGPIAAVARYIYRYNLEVPEPLVRVAQINIGTLEQPNVRVLTFLRQRHGKLYYVEAPSSAYLIDTRATIPIYKFENDLATRSKKTADHAAIRSSYDALIRDMNELQGRVARRDSAAFA